MHVKNPVVHASVRQIMEDYGNIKITQHALKRVKTFSVLDITWKKKGMHGHTELSPVVTG